LSISDKLMDYDQTVDLLSRLSREELEELAKRNGIKLEREDLSGRIRKARTKAQIIEILLESEFKEADLIELLGVSRLTKDELLNCMSVRQLKQLARETGVELVRSSLFGTKKATRKRDIIRVLSVLSTSKIREFAEKTRLIKRIREKARRRRPAKAKARIISKRRRKAAPKKAPPPRKKAEKPKRPKVKPAVEEEARRILPEVPPERAVGIRGRLIEETVKEKVTERRIVRRVILYEAIEREISKALEEFSPRASEKESGYERQLSELFRKMGITPDEKRRRGDFNFIFSRYGIAVELKPVRDAGALSRLAEKISKHMDQYERVFAVVVDESGKPEKTRRGIEKLGKIDPEKIRVLIKKPKKRRKRSGSKK